MKTRLFAACSLGAALVLTAAATGAIAADANRETVTPAYSYPISNVPGKSLTALIVTYAPDGKTPAHRHGRSFIAAYVLEGSIRSQVDNGEVKVYKAGESWTEKPGARHRLSENASATEPAKIMAVFVAKTGAKDLFTLDSDLAKKK